MREKIEVAVHNPDGTTLVSAVDSIDITLPNGTEIKVYAQTMADGEVALVIESQSINDYYGNGIEVDGSFVDGVFIKFT